MFDWLLDKARSARRTEVIRKTTAMIPPERVTNDPSPDLVDGKAFKSGGCYFGVRLAGLHIRDATQFGTTRLPLFVSFAGFTQRGRDRTVPFSIGPRDITNKLTSVGADKDGKLTPGWVELTNMRIVPPTPVGVGNLSLFVGLYSVPGSDIVSTLLDVVGDLSKSAGAFVPMAAVTPALDIAKTVYSGFGSLVGLDSLQPLVQADNGRALPGTGSGYLVVANTQPETVETEKIGVRAGKLCRGDVMVTDFDYCLIAIERYSTILEEGSGIAPDLFDSEWQEVLKTLDSEQTGASRVAMRKLLAAIRGAPALIDADRTAAMTAYLRRYAEETSLSDQVNNATRGAQGASATDLMTILDTHAGASPMAKNKLAAVLDLVETSQEDPAAGRKKTVAELAAESRVELEKLGEGADDALADVLMRAV